MTQHCRSRAGEQHDMCELAHGMAGERHRNSMGTAWAWHAMCEFALNNTNSVGLLGSKNRPVAEKSTWQQITLATNRHPRHRRDLNPQSLQASGRRPTPWSARQLGLADKHVIATNKFSNGTRHYTGYSESLRPGRPGDRIPMEATFSTPVQTGPWTHPASWTMDTVCFLRRQSGRGMRLTTHPHLQPV
jgi:hypothetical protein